MTNCTASESHGSTGSEATTREAPLRVLHVVPQLGGGGTERVVLTLLPLLDREVRDPSLCVLGSLNAFPSRTTGVNITGFLGYDGSLRDLRGMQRCIRSLREMILDTGTEIVHSHLWPAARLAAMALRGSSVRHIVHVHDTRPWLAAPDWRNWLLRAWTNSVVPRSRPTYIAVSRAAKEYTCRHLNVPESSVEVIPNGVDLRQFRPKPAAAKTPGAPIVIGTVARMEPEKGHRDLIEAVALLRAEGLNVELRLAGDGSLRKELEAKASTEGIADRVVFAGLIEEVERFFHSLDIFVLPSVFGEGLPMTILEAMACQVPVIASDVAGACEVIQSRHNGLLVPPEDPTELAEALAELVSDESRRQQLGDAGLATVRADFCFESVSRRIDAAYAVVASQ